MKYIILYLIIIISCAMIPEIASAARPGEREVCTQNMQANGCEEACNGGRVLGSRAGGDSRCRRVCVCSTSQQ